MLEIGIVVSALFLLLVVFWPRRDKTKRRVTRSFNGRHYGSAKELY